MFTIEEAAAILRKEWFDSAEGKGSHCVICDRWGKYNAVRLTKVLVRSLAWMCAVSSQRTNGFVHMPTEAPRFVTRSYAFSKLKHWGLVVSVSNSTENSAEEKTRTSGLWKPTPLAYDFLNGTALLPEHVFVYNDARVGVADKLISVHDCMEKHFDYGEMMATTFNGSGDVEFDND